MLGAMDIPVASAGPWITLGVVLGVLLVALAGLSAAGLLRRPSGTPGTGPVDADGNGAEVDDLPGFLEHPPGTGAETSPADGWVALAAPPAGSPPVPVPTASSGTRRVLLAMALTALLLIGAAATVAGLAQRPAPSSPPTAVDADGGDERPPGAEARLVFGGVVLERRAVGVTATYPQVVVTGTGRGARATVQLPTWNCLTTEAPADPAAAGCTRAGTEYAELATPGLRVTRDGDELRVSGLFATTTRPNGSPPQRTGRAYELVVTASPTRDPSVEDWTPAAGVLHLGDDRAETVDGEAELRYPG
jgi:hypothetical protein